MKFYFPIPEAARAQRPQSKADHVKIVIDYEIGGMNYFSGSVNRRGIYIYITPVQRSEHGETVALFGNAQESGFKIMLEELQRKSQKRLDFWEAKTGGRARELAELYLAGKYEILSQIVKS